MSQPETKDFWAVSVIQRTTLKVVFEEPIAASEVEECLLCGDYDDIIDETDQEIIKVEKIS